MVVIVTLFDLLNRGVIVLLYLIHPYMSSTHATPKEYKVNEGEVILAKIEQDNTWS